MANNAVGVKKTWILTLKKMVGGHVMVSVVCSVSENVPSASSLKYKQGQPSQGWGTLAHGLRLRTGCVATVKPFCVWKPSHLHGLAELEQTSATWVRGRREHHPTLLVPTYCYFTASKASGTCELFRLLHSTGTRSVKRWPRYWRIQKYF